MKLYLVRHGESEANATVSFSTPQTQLTEMGIEDGKMAGRLLSGISFDRILSSPYLRAIQTQAAAIPGVEAEIVDELHEFDCGSLNGMTFAAARAENPDLQELMDVDDYTRFGGEDYATVRERVRAFMRYAEGLKADKIVAFSHSGFILTFFDEVMQRKGKKGRNIFCSNGSVSVFECRGGSWFVRVFGATERL